eukprot:9145832-Alexandrium_andersonii.AAC.1
MPFRQLALAVLLTALRLEEALLRQGIAREVLEVRSPHGARTRGSPRGSKCACCKVLLMPPTSLAILLAWQA